jgi:hypothetical protein
MTRSRLTGLLALICLIALTFLFFWKILLTNLILAGVDTFLYFYPYKAYAGEALRQGRLPLWNPHLFMGAPLLANSQVGMFYPPNWLFLWLDPPKQVAWSIGLHIALAGSLMLAYARLSLKLSWPASLVAAILFAFGGYLGAQVEHINQLNAAAWLPLLFLFYDFGVERERGWLWFLLLALVIALTLLAGHAQTVFISLFGLGLYALWRAGEWRMANGEWQTANLIHTSQSAIRSLATSLLRHLTPLAFAALLAVALAAVQLLPTAELSSLSIRSGGLTLREAISFRLQPSMLLYALLPPLGLDLSQVLGEAFGEWVAYVGVSGLILALLGGWCALWRPEIRRYLGLAGSGLLLSLGWPYAVLYYLVPGFALFRVPARWLLLYAFAVAVLAGFGLDALREPAPTRERLASTWRWLRTRWWRLAIFVGLPLAFLLVLIVWRMPPLMTLLAWLLLAVITFYVLRFTFYVSRLSVIILIILLLTELFLSAQSVAYNQPTAPQAYSSLRNAPAYLLAADPPAGQTPPGRFLSLSGITYDPGDLYELRQIFGSSLSEKALYNLIVATKEKEVLFFNLPLVYGLHSVDGYDGGVLPLKQFVSLQKLFLPPGDLSIDGRLREKLRFVPPGRLLSLLNTRWIITDKQFDVWIDDIFYDLQFPARLSPGQSIAVVNNAGGQGGRGARGNGVQSEALSGGQEIPDFPATAIGLVSHLEGAANLPAGTPVAEVSLTFADGGSTAFTLKAGTDTAEGYYSADVAHPQAKIGVAWPYEAGGVDYITVYPLTDSQAASRRVNRISVTTTLPTGQFVLRGVSLIHQPTTTSRSVLLTTEGDYRQVHSGDVKIYENQGVLPRAFIVHRAEVVENEDEAIAAMQNPAFDPARTMARLRQAEEPAGLQNRGRPSPQDQAVILAYAPERVEVKVRLDSPGWLVLTDTYYPGWQATLDGSPTEILPVNIMFRAVAVPEGEHTLVFEFKPGSVVMGGWISVGALAASVIALVLSLRQSAKKML